MRKIGNFSSKCPCKENRYNDEEEEHEHEENKKMKRGSRQENHKDLERKRKLFTPKRTLVQHMMMVMMLMENKYFSWK